MIGERVYVPYASKKTGERVGKADLLTVLGEKVDRLISKEYGPATLLVNNNLDIIVFRGDVAPYLSPESGAASLNVTKIIRKDVRSQVQTAVYRARKENKVFNETVRFKQKGHTKTVNVEIRPLKTPEYDEPFYLVLFTEETLQEMNTTKELESAVSSGETETLKDRQIRELREDLEATKQSLQTLVEGHEATNEELQSSMEEVQSSNEELQSTNEELETAKEELQSGNEELQTLNEELKNRNQTLGRLNDDLANLQTNTDVSVVIVDNDLKVRRFTASAQELLKISPSDVGQSITNVNPGFPIEYLEKILIEVTTQLTVVSKEVTSGESRCHEMRVRPYLTSEKKIDGAVISFVDITERKLLEKERNLHTRNLETQVKEQATKIVQSERLAAIGQTVAMVGHDLRNPLQTIRGEAYLARGELQTLPESEQKISIIESVDTIEEQIKYMDKIIIDLQSFVKPIEVHKETINLKQLITGILSQIDLPKNVETNIKIGDALTVVADPHLLKRVFINLSTNAVQAMPKGGVLTIKAQPSSQGQVQIIVEDTGVGIPDEIKAKIFTPLFTTRAKGQGFGLAVCKRVMEAQGGTISFDSQVGKGTAFIVGLPLKGVKP